MDNITGYTDLPKDLLTEEQYAIVMESGSVLWTVLSFLGIISNIINIRTFIAMGLSDGVTVSFLFLSLFDLSFLMMTFCFSVSMGFQIIERKSNLLFALEPYGMFLIFVNTSILISVTNTLTTTFLAVARCMCVAKPFHFKNYFTRKRTVFFNVGFLVFAVAMYTPILANMGMLSSTDKRRNITRPSLWMSKEREAIKDIVLLVNNSLLPLVTEVIIVVCIFVMVNSLRESSRFRQASTMASGDVVSQTGQIDQSEKKQNSTDIASDKLSGKEQRVVQQVILISAAYIICNTIKIVISVVGVSEPQFRVTGQHGRLYASVHCLHTYFEIGNASVNTFIYCSYNTKFRNSMLHIVSCCSYNTKFRTSMLQFVSG